MKKTICFILSMMLLLSSCSNGKGTTESMPYQTFSTTADELIERIDTALVENNRSKISDLLRKDRDASAEKMSELNLRAYYISDYVGLFFYETKPDSSLLQIVFIADLNNADIISLRDFAFQAGAMLGCLDPDDGERIDKELNMSNLYEDREVTASGKNCDYIFTVNDGRVDYRILPSGAPVLETTITDTQSQPSQSSPNAASSIAANTPSSTSPSRSSVTETLPEKDEFLSAELSKYMLDNFGGMGKPEYAAAVAGWYKYIQNLEVYKQDGTYFEILTLTEKPADANIRLILSRSLSEASLDYCVPIILDAGAALDLDEASMCLVGQDIVAIMNGGDTPIEIIYASLLAYNIPVYSYLAAGTGNSEADVMANIDKLVGTQFAELILDHMNADFGGSFKGLSSESVKTAAMAAMTNYKNETFNKDMVEKIIVEDISGNEIISYDNLSFTK